MSKFPHLPLFVDAYLADTGHLTDAEHGRYMLLLMAMWKAPKCRLPNDDAWLARKFRRSVEDVRSNLRPIIKEFMHLDGNWIRQRRLSKEWKYVTEIRQKNSVSAKSRWHNKKDLHSRNAPRPILERRKKERVLDDRASAMRPTRGKNVSQETFERFWKAYPKRKGGNPKAPAAKLFTAAVKQGADPSHIVAAIEAQAGFDPDKIGTEYIPQAVKWLRDKRWEAYTPPDPQQQAERAAFMAARGYVWAEGRWQKTEATHAAA